MKIVLNQSQNHSLSIFLTEISFGCFSPANFLRVAFCDGFGPFDCKIGTGTKSALVYPIEQVKT